MDKALPNDLDQSMLPGKYIPVRGSGGTLESCVKEDDWLLRTVGGLSCFLGVGIAKNIDKEFLMWIRTLLQYIQHNKRNW